MTTTNSQAKNLIIKFGIQAEMEKTFSYILTNNSCDELDIEDKNFSISTKNIEHQITESGFHKFQTPIINSSKNKVGYFAIVVTNANERIDEYFVITK